jgi:hypothetical protein
MYMSWNWRSKYMPKAKRASAVLYGGCRPEVQDLTVRILLQCAAVVLEAYRDSNTNPMNSF